MEPLIPDDDVEILAREMMRHFPEDGAARAIVHAEAVALAGLGHGEKSKKWRLVSEEIERMQGRKRNGAEFGRLPQSQRSGASAGARDV